ncbi:MAG: hypothetical protein EZS28_019329 [Streblomastix strix]|uniref:Uncharacterized protein n=1 Tax=Streblomastix strix TaxID=222440 RepID=A0A5J4VS47_9EUKA|nr:MAG: hypothetical protein EZS28_019329 [Streblomastix strix]
MMLSYSDALLDNKLILTDKIDAYTKQETDALLHDKLNITDQIDAYTKQEADALLDDKLNITDQIDAYTKQEDDTLLLLKADKTELIDAYTKQEADALLDDKLNITNQIDAYNKSEVDALFDDKLNVSDQIDAYPKTEADALLDEKLNINDQIEYYSKTEDDVLLLLKADKTELDNYIDLASTQMIIGQKQFRIISVSNISKQNKNDAYILLAGVGDMLVSSLVSQPQLQEVRDIASGKSKGYVFATTDVMNTWMADSENVAKLANGLRALEIELLDMSNVMTILGAATGGGNAITDLSFEPNTLILAKNSSFITTNYDETITGQKTFNTTIHSVGILVQNYDYNSVVCAVGCVKSIQDINTSVDFSNYYNKSQTYSQTEADALLDDKLYVSDQIDTYNKQEDDALLLLKADKTQLIDSYIKGENDNLHNNKANSGVSFTKGENDALLLLKADKTQLIDSYTKGEVDNLLNNNANSGVSYTKGEDDALLLLKANQSITYTKSKTDFLMSQIEVGDVDLIGYMTYGTAQTITANKTFFNACGFVSSIDGMVTITGSLFVKSGAEYTFVLFGAGGTKPISEFAGIPTDLSDNYTKTQTYSKTETDNKYIKLDGSIQQTITGRLKYVSSFGLKYDETQDPVANTYLTMSEIDSKLTNYINTTNNQEINGTKTFNANDNASGFVKTGKDDTSDLLAGGCNRLLSLFGRIEDLISSAFSKLYAYIKEHYHKPIGELPQPVPIGDQTLQQQVKNYDDIIYASNEAFEPPVPKTITKLDLSWKFERQSFLASNSLDPQLIAYGDRITLTASYATTTLFPNGGQLEVNLVDIYSKVIPLKQDQKQVIK